MEAHLYQVRLGFGCNCRLSKSNELRAQAKIVLAEYEEVKGFEAQHLGHTITAVFDPDPVSATGFISVFAEPQEAAEFLTYKRGR